jgi:hypothetical protein
VYSPIFHELTGCLLHSALEIVSKLCDDDFARRAKSTDFLGKAWDALRAAGGGDGDKVSAFLQAVFGYISYS